MPQIPEDMGFNEMGYLAGKRRMITSIKVPGERNFPFLTTDFPSRPYKLRRTGLGAEETAILPTGQEITFLPNSGVPEMTFSKQRDPQGYVEPKLPNRISETPEQVQVVGPNMIVPLDTKRNYKRINAATPTPSLTPAGKGVAVTPEDFIFKAETTDVEFPGLPKELLYQQVPQVERPGPEVSAELYPDEVDAQRQDFNKAMREYGQEDWTMDGCLRVSDGTDVASIGQAPPAYGQPPTYALGPSGGGSEVDWGKTAAEVLSTGIKTGAQILASKYAPKPAPAAPAPVFYSAPPPPQATGTNLNLILGIAGGGLAVLGVVIYLMRR